MTELPSGTVTFLFTDIEGSTALLKALGRDRYDGVLVEHTRLLSSAFAAHEGRVVDTQGDSFFVAFRTAADAVAAAVDAQRDLAAQNWPEGAEVKVRMGLHTGEPRVGEERYVGVRTISSAGPYYVASYSPGQGVVLKRNPNYTGSRPHRLNRIELTVNVSQKQTEAAIKAGNVD